VVVGSFAVVGVSGFVAVVVGTFAAVVVGTFVAVVVIGFASVAGSFVAVVVAGFASVVAAGFASIVGAFTAAIEAVLWGRGAAGAPRPDVERSAARGAAGAVDAGFCVAASGAGGVPAPTPFGVGLAGGVAFSGVVIKCSRCRAGAWRDKGKIEPGA
jgi:hypothetical protein